MYNCVCVTGRTYCIGTVSQSVVKHSHCGQLEPMKMNAEHPLAEGGFLQAVAPPHQILKLKKKHSYLDMMLSNFFCYLPSSKTQTMKLVDE